MSGDEKMFEADSVKQREKNEFNFLLFKLYLNYFFKYVCFIFISVDLFFGSPFSTKTKKLIEENTDVSKARDRSENDDG